MKKIMALVMAFLIICPCTYTCVFAAESSYRYVPPYDDVDGGRAKQNMPEIFSFEAAKKEKLFDTIEFKDSDFPEKEKIYYTSDMQNLYIDNEQIKVVKPEVTADVVLPTVYWNADANSSIPMGTYAFVCKSKIEQTYGDSAKSDLIALNSKKEKIAQSYKRYTKDLGNGWVETICIMFLEDEAKQILLRASIPKDAIGTFYYDDFELYRIADDPLEMVLKQPNYKGLIYGDGEADIDLDVTIGERTSYYPLESMNLSVRLVDENDNVYRYSYAESLSNLMNFVFSSKGLSEGDYYLIATLTDKETGEVISKKERTIRKRASDYRPDTYLDENGRIIKNGEKTFLRRMYSASKIFTESAETAKNAGIDTISHYSASWWMLKENSRDESISPMLKYLEDNDMDIHISMAEFQYSELSDIAKKVITNQEDILPLLTKVAEDYKDEDYFAGYYITDEKDPRTLGEEIRWNNEILAQEDIDHPTFGVTDQVYNCYGIFNKMVDILGVDSYPVTGKAKDKDGNPTYDDISVVGDKIREIKKLTPNRSVYLVVQGFHNTKLGDLRGPTEAESRNMAWQGICEGVDGLDWFIFNELYTNEETKDEWLAKLNNVFAEVEQYEDIILSDEPAPKYSVSGGGDWLNILVKRYNGKTYVFAVNNTYVSHSASVQISGLSTQNLSFEPLEVKQIELEQSEFLSPEAELKTIGFSNGKETFEVSMGEEENILYVHKNSGVINYNAKISDGAKLYMGSKEMPLNGKITVKVAEKFTVSVVAENGKDRYRKTFRIVKR